MRKKILATALVATMVFGLVGCGSGSGDGSQASNSGSGQLPVACASLPK